MSIRNHLFKYGLILLLLSIFSHSEQVFGQVQSSSPGSWIETNTWAGGIVPGDNDTVLKDVVIKNDSVVIPYGSTIEINNLTIDGGGKLVVNGRLIVHQNVLMTNTSVGYSMGPSAAVIIYGNFEIKNQVKISLSSFLVIYGNFIKSGSSTQGDVSIDEGNIYVLGEVSGNGWPNDFGCTSGDYSGTTPDETQNCDYGNQQDYEENQEDFPDDLVDLINCYDLSSISATPTCPGGTSTFSINNSELNNVNYEWQVKNGESWSIIGTSPTISIPNIQDFNKEYRVLVRPTGEFTCRISISRNIKIEKIEGTIWTGTISSDWNNPSNWSCNEVPALTINATIPAGTPYPPILQSGSNGGVKNLVIDSGASLQVTNRELSIAGNLSIAGTFDAAEGSVKFSGTAVQSIPGGTFENDLVYDLIIDNPSGVISQASIEIINSLKIINGTFETGNALTLISNASGTAFIVGSGGGQITGMVKMQRYLSSGFGYKYFSSPFSTSVVGDFIPFMDLTHPTTSFPHFFTYNENREDATGEDISGWETYIDPLSALTPGIGYAANISAVNDPVTIELEGAINTGNISLSLQNNNGTYTKGFHLVGNPYPSPIDWDLVNKNGIDDALYFFTAGTADRYTGTYTSYINGVSNDGRSSNIIPSMQGFFVKVSTPGTTGILEFSNAARTGNSPSQIFYKAKRNTVASKLVLSAGYNDVSIEDALVLYAFPGSTFNFESSFDAQKLMNTSVEVPSLYTLTPTREKLSINAVSGFTTNKLLEIPLGLNVLKSGKMKLALKEAPATLFSPYIYLKDMEEKVLWDLKSEYSFTSQKGEFNNRFSLVLSPNKLDTRDLKSAFSAFDVSTASGEIFVETRLPEGLEGKLQLIAISGKVLQQKKISGKEEVRFKGLQTGIYLVTLSSKEGKETRKILVQQ